MEAYLNLARKWRSRDFSQIVGQDIAVGILKNSLFLGKFFPVYLFSGQHGCGKTTAARVFAAAANCAKLADFQKNPQQDPVPCGTCASCMALVVGKHPDFIEIDAASNTGVDNVRTIIEAASLMPALGRKKIYLIDEAHMLSKAAFNAFLKILEEPPIGVFFILATTDEHKIIETVKSRCFQLIFDAVNSDTLCAHLSHVCTHENIAHEPEALSLIVSETGGSVRDALTLVEQIFLSKQRVFVADVHEQLGHLSQAQVVELGSAVLAASSPAEIIQLIDHIKLGSYNADHVWQRLLRFFHALVWTKYGVIPKEFSGDSAILEKIVSEVSAQVLGVLFNQMCAQEPVFLRTINKTLFVQYALVNLWERAHSFDAPASFSKEVTRASLASSRAPQGVIQAQPVSQDFKAPEQIHTHPVWDEFVAKSVSLNEPLLTSLLKQAQFVSHENTVVTIALSQRLLFFGDTFKTLKDKWLPVLRAHFGPDSDLETKFTLSDQKTGSSEQNTVAQQKSSPVSRSNFSPSNGPGRQAIDVSDKSKWPLTHQLLETFSGTVSEIPQAPVAAQAQNPEQ